MFDNDYVKQILFGREYYYEKDNLNFNGNPLPSVSKYLHNIMFCRRKRSKIYFIKKSVSTNP